MAVHFASLRGAAIVRGDGELEKSLISYLNNLTTSLYSNHLISEGVRMCGDEQKSRPPAPV